MIATTFRLCMMALRDNGPLSRYEITQKTGRSLCHVGIELRAAEEQGYVRRFGAGNKVTYALTGKNWRPHRGTRKTKAAILYANDGMCWVFPSMLSVAKFKRVSPATPRCAIINGHMLKGERIETI
jgi:hypothetical protein